LSDISGAIMPFSFEISLVTVTVLPTDELVFISAIATTKNEERKLVVLHLIAITASR
jgi:hypothetical protein